MKRMLGLVWLLGACAAAGGGAVPRGGAAPGGPDAPGAGKRDGEPAGCTSSGDCPSGAKRCVAGACVARVDSGLAACGVHGGADGVGASCAAGSCSAWPAAPLCIAAGQVSFCSRACSRDDDCGAGAFCGRPGPGDARCVPFDCACLASDGNVELLALVAAAAGREVCDVGHRAGDLDAVYPVAITYDPHRLSLYERLYYAPTAIPATERRLTAALDAARAAGAPLSGALRVAAELWDETLPEELGPPAAAASFVDAVLAFWPPAERAAQRASVTAAARGLPGELTAQLTPILAALARATELATGAFPAGADLTRYATAPISMFWYDPDVARAARVDLSKEPDRSFFAGVRYRDLVRAAAEVAQAVERAQLGGLQLPGGIAFSEPTPRGRIVISGAADDAHRADDPRLTGELLLFVDVGGDDRYEIPVGATTSPQHPLSLALDLGGDDLYSYVKVPDPGDVNERPASDAAGRRPAVPRYSRSLVARQGGARLGVGLLCDLGGGRDRYESLRFSQGSGILGVGALYDDGGDDSYDAEAAVQGAAHFGIGLLVDGGGNDTYHAYALSQGAVHVKGVGLVVDHGGNDSYWVSPGNAYIAAPDRRSEHDYLYEYGVNQGAAWGRRADYPMDGIKNGTYSSGGVGALIDRGGNDSYTCGAFCQGTGYWFGVGLLLDGDGDDRYAGRVFAGASGVHFGVGVLVDRAGDDSYHEDSHPLLMTLGAGDDLSLAWFEDRGGDDRYAAARHALGSGTEKGVGVFLEHRGSDRYAGDKASRFGWAEDPAEFVAPTHKRFPLPTQGLFVDGAGQDVYAAGAAGSIVGEGRTWSRPQMVVGGGPAAPASPRAFGVGIDRP